ncbi:putative ATPase [Arcicella rosea]|uniref:AAA family ATPase n=1 Tax=Arcicella rosea TaxID=502909 RepID=UPI00345CB0A6
MLRKVRIQNFKSLKDVTLELQKVNLLIGPNNSGKSNFLKGLELWGKSILDETNGKFIKKKEDLEEYSFKHSNENLIFEIDTETDRFERIIKLDEDLDLTYLTNLNGYPYPDERLSSNNARYFITDLKRNILQNIRIYKIFPETFVKPQPISGVVNYFLSENGYNIVAFLDFLKDEHKNLYKKLERDLHKCIPEFTDINLKTVVSPEGDLRTHKKWGLGKDDVKYWSNELSEGVLYFLAILCIIHQPNPPKLLLLEEPEKGIHPRRIHEIMKFIFQLVEDKDIQVIMTSHNEHVLEEFTTMPEAVFIFDKDDEGATFVKNLQKDIIEPGIIKAKEFGIDPIDYTDNIGENWFMGLMGGVPA